MTTPPEKKARPVLTLTVPPPVSTTVKNNTSPTDTNSKNKLPAPAKGIKCNYQFVSLRHNFTSVTYVVTESVYDLVDVVTGSLCDLVNVVANFSV